MSVPLLIISQLTITSDAKEVGGRHTGCPLINIWKGPAFSYHADVVKRSATHLAVYGAE